MGSIENNSNMLGEFEVYFCPQEDCEDALVQVLEASQESIYFATFVLTLDLVEQTLIEQSLRNVTIRGVVEPRLMNTRGSRIKNMSEFFAIRKDTNPKTMHHKLFI